MKNYKTSLSRQLQRIEQFCEICFILIFFKPSKFIKMENEEEKKNGEKEK